MFQGDLKKQLDSDADGILSAKELARFLGEKDVEMLSMKPGIIEDVKKKIDEIFPTSEAKQEFLQTLSEFEVEMTRLEREKTSREKQSIDWSKKQIDALKSIVQSGVAGTGKKPDEPKKNLLGTDYQPFSGKYSYKGEGPVDPMREEKKPEWKDPERTRKEKIKYDKPLPIKEAFVKKMRDLYSSVDVKNIDDTNILSAAKIIVERTQKSLPPIGENKEGWESAGYIPDGIFGRLELKGLAKLEGLYTNSAYPEAKRYIDEFVGIISKPEGIKIKTNNMSEFAKSIEKYTMAKGIKVEFENGLLKFSHREGKDIAKVITFRLAQPTINLSQIKYSDGVLYVGKMSVLPNLFLRGDEKGIQADRNYKDEILLGGTDIDNTLELKWHDYSKTKENNPAKWDDFESSKRTEKKVSKKEVEFVNESNLGFEGLLHLHSRRLRYITWLSSNSKYYTQFKTSLSVGNFEGARSSACMMLDKSGLHSLSKIMKQETNQAKLSYLCASLADTMMSDSLSEKAFEGSISAKNVILESRRLRAFYSYTANLGINLSTEVHELAGKFGGPHKIPVYKDNSMISLVFSSRLNSNKRVMYRGFDMMPPGIASVAGGYETPIYDKATKRYSVERISNSIYFSNIISGIESMVGKKLTQKDKENLKEHIIDNSKPLNIGGKQITLDIEHILFAYGRCLNPSIGLRIKGIIGIGNVSFNEYGLLVRSRYKKEIIPDINDDNSWGGGNGGDTGGECSGSGSAGGSSGGGAGGGQ